MLQKEARMLVGSGSDLVNLKVISAQNFKPGRLQDLVSTHFNELRSGNRGKMEDCQRSNPTNMTLEVSAAVLQSAKRKAPEKIEVRYMYCNMSLNILTKMLFECTH